MKNQALFSSKDKSKKLKCLLLQFLFEALKVGSCCFKCIVILQIYFLKLLVSTFYKEISKSQQKVQS